MLFNMLFNAIKHVIPQLFIPYKNECIKHVVLQGIMDLTISWQSPLVVQQPHSDDRTPESVLSYGNWLLAVASYLIVLL